MKKVFLLGLILSNSSFGLDLPSDSYKIQTGIEVVPLEKFGMDSYELEKVKKEFNEQKVNGYVEINTNYPKRLLRIEAEEKNTLAQGLYDNNPYDTHIKNKLDKIKLNFQFKYVPINHKNIIGYAPIGTYVNGWDGIKVFFKDKDLGVCHYSLDHVIYVKLDKNNATKAVNNKYSMIGVTGNKQDGFLYRIAWYETQTDSVLSKELECANQVYAKSITENLVKKAILIDSAK